MSSNGDVVNNYMMNFRIEQEFLRMIKVKFDFTYPYRLSSRTSQKYVANNT